MPQTIEQPTMQPETGHVTPVEAEPHKCEDGTIVCDYRGYDLISPDSNEVIFSQPKGDINEQEQ